MAPHTHTHTRTRIYTHLHIFAHIHTCTNTCTHVHTNAHIHTRSHPHVHTRSSRYDLTDSGVTIVEDLAKKRQPMLDVEAVYLCTPNSQNAKYILDDFVPKAK